MKRTLAAIVCLLSLCYPVIAGDAGGSAVVIELSKPLPGGRGLGTMDYAPTGREAAFLKKVNEEPPPTWMDVKMPPPMGEKADPAKDAEKEKEREAARAKAKEYTLLGQEGKYVGWFGIVRAKTWNQEARQTALLLEHKYFDGLTDLHIQVVSIFGAGDFAAIVPGKAEQIPALGLVRVYGKVLKGKDGLPALIPEYVRVWDWGLFTFMDYGADRSNPKWVELRKVDAKDVYSPRPSKEFYEKRLGTREP